MARTEPIPTWRNLFYPPAGYRYFDAPAGTNPVRSPALKEAWLADAAMLAYGRDDQRRFSRMEMAEKLYRGGFQNFALLGDWSAGARGTQGFFAYSPEWAVMSFRGTEVEDWRDLATDADAVLVEESNHNPHPGVIEKTLSHLPSLRPVLQPDKAGVHAGFQLALNRVWREASDWLSGYRAQYPSAEICFTGHSLGAALATIAITRAGDGARCSLYAFGCPRVGNRAFNEHVRRQSGGGWFRYVNGSDLVTQLPPSLFRYEHDLATLQQFGSAAPEPAPLAMLQLLYQAGTVRIPEDLDKQPPQELVDHSPARYCHQLWTRFESATAAAGAR